MVVLIATTMLVFDLALKQALIIVFLINSLRLFLLGVIKLDVAKLPQSLEDVLLAVLHLDRVDDLLYLAENVVVLHSQTGYDLLPPEK